MNQPKILCIDDTPDVLLLLRRLLSSHYVVVEASDGLRGIETAVETQPDLILVDLHMPHLTGYEVATRLKSLMPQTPVVALTADESAHVRERALTAGCDGFLTKPIDLDTFMDQLQAYLSGEREEFEDERYLQDYQQRLVERLEEKVQQNVKLLEKARRQTRLLEAGAKVGRILTSILDLETLLSTTVDVLCDEFDFYYAGVFLIEATGAQNKSNGEWAVLHAGRGEAGATMVAQGHKLKVGGRSVIGAAIRQRQAIIALDVDEESAYSKESHLPYTRSEMALPLLVGGEVIGALTVQSTKEAAFSDDDVTALQATADQLAIAINNARLLRDLEAAHAELVQTKTFRVIATATGEAIHWVGNKAAPIPGSVARVAEDLVRYLVMVHALLAEAPPALREHGFAQLLTQAVQAVSSRGVVLEEIQDELEALPLNRLHKILNIESIFEDLGIIENSARAILNIKEDLIGPARQRKLEAIFLPDLLKRVIASMGIPEEVVRTLFTGDRLSVQADRVQLERVLINLLKNALEAMEEVEDKKLFVWTRQADEPDFVVVDVIDNGVGIPPENVDEIWMPFYTTKGSSGGTGLGLPACAQVVEQLGGKILVDSEVGLGTTFSVFLPVLETP
jgi:signal transduction histidine kinase/DNA-binding response OmpR family regulator